MAADKAHGDDRKEKERCRIFSCAGIKQPRNKKERNKLAAMIRKLRGGRR